MNQILNSIDDLPAISCLLFEENLTPDEKKHFVFAEGEDGQVYNFVNTHAPDLLKRRAQTFRTFNFADRKLVVYQLPPEILVIFRDLMTSEKQVHMPESELDTRFNEILLQAIRADASDIHFDFYPERTILKFRIHGMLFKEGELDSRSVNRLINYIYNVAAQEGSKDTQFNPEEMQHAMLDRHLTVNGQRRHFKLRMQTAACFPNSITIVMRVLPVDSQVTRTLESLGYSQEQIDLLYRAQMQPSGVTIIAGTTGSGKSTTLACMLSDIHKRCTGTKKILTAEDPPEYTIAGANQINLSTKRYADDPDKNSFAQAIKVAMRCDPDIIMVGEIRDKKSSDLLSSAVLSGHQVLTTVHAPSVLAIIERMINLGFERHVISMPKFVSLLMYQTLVPIVCSHCRIPLEDFFNSHTDRLDKLLETRITALLERLGGPEEKNQIYFARKEGCRYCRAGYTERTVIAELAAPDSQLLDFFRLGDLPGAYRYWRKTGGQTIMEHGVKKMLTGMVDPRSVENACGFLDKQEEW